MADELGTIKARDYRFKEYIGWSIHTETGKVKKSIEALIELVPTRIKFRVVIRVRDKSPCISIVNTFEEAVELFNKEV